MYDVVYHLSHAWRYFSPHSVRMRKNTDQRNSEYRYFSRNVCVNDLMDCWRSSTIHCCKYNVKPSSKFWSSVSSLLVLLFSAYFQWQCITSVMLNYVINNALYHWHYIISSQHCILSSTLHFIINAALHYRLHNILFTIHYINKATLDHQRYII